MDSLDPLLSIPYFNTITMTPSDGDDLDLPNIGKKCKSLGHNMVWLFPSSSHMEPFFFRWNHLRLGQCLLRNKLKGKTSLPLRGCVIRGVRPNSWKRSMRPTPLQVLLWLIWRFHLWSPKGYQYQSPEMHLDINKTNSRQTAHPGEGSPRGSSPCPFHLEPI